jgi:hypothetical protein
MVATSGRQSPARGPLAVERVGDGVADEYAAFVDDHPASTAFHTLAWRRAVGTGVGYEPAYRLVRSEAREGEAVAAVPAFRVHEPVGRSRTNPFCEYGYPLVAEGTDPVAVLETLADPPGRLGAVVLKESPQSGIGGYSEAGYGGVETGLTVRLSLDAPFDRLRSDVFANELRRNATRARDRGVTVVESDDHAAFHELYVDTMRRLGSPQLPPGFVRALARAFGDAFGLHVAMLDGEPVAGLVSLVHDGTCHLLLNGADRGSEDAGANHLLYLDRIERAAESGCEVVDFGRTEPGSGVHTFKRQFGGREVPLASFVTPPGRTGRADVSGLKALAPVTRALAPIVTHPAIGPRLKRLLHE